MFRIDNSSAVPALPVPGPPGTPGFFTDGNPAAALEATIVDAWWCNILQEEIITVINAAGLPLNKASHTQLFEALNQLYSGAGTGVYLPLIGGTLYLAGAGDRLNIHADAGHYARIMYECLGVRRWAAGVDPLGQFRFSDETAGSAARFWLGADGNATFTGLVRGSFVDATNNLSCGLDAFVGSDLAVAGGVGVAGEPPVYGTVRAPYIIAANNLSCGVDAHIAQFLHVNGAIGVGTAPAVTGSVRAMYLQALFDFSCGADAHVGQFLTVDGAVAVGVAPVSGSVRAPYLWCSMDTTIGRDLYVLNDTTLDGHLAVAGGLAAGGAGLAAGSVRAPYIDALNNLSCGVDAHVAQFVHAGGVGVAGEPPVYGVVRAPYIIAANNLSCGADLYVAGIPYNIGGTGMFDTVSDARLKENVAGYDRGLEALLQLSPISFELKERRGVRCYGLDAAETEPFMPELVNDRTMAVDGEDTAVKMLNAGPLVYALINATKELATRLAILEERMSHG